MKPWGRTLIRLDLLTAIPEDYYRWIEGRSGLENICGIIVHNGTIDSDYRGIVCVVLFNLLNKYLVEAGNRISQLIITCCFRTKFVEVNKFMEEKTDRGEKFFGSSDVQYFLGISIMSCEQ